MKQFLKNNHGSTTVEYGMIGFFVFLVIVTAVKVIGPSTANLYQSVIPGLEGGKTQVFRGN
jgi:Flp pilus assembly pilin Flp